MKRPRPVSSSEAIAPDFQIAPMIDIVFVITLFFMVMAGMVRAERELSTRLPSGCPVSSQPLLPAEITISIDADGLLELNEEPVGSAQLRHALLALRSQSKVIATIEASSAAEFQSIIQVLNELSATQIQDVTFGVAPETW